MTYGYVRVSTKEQIVDRQLVAMKAADVTNILIDKASGKDFDRPQYKKLRKKLKRGDLLVVQSLDRFGRSYDDIIDEWRYLVKTVGVDVKVLDMPLLDTRQGGGLIGKFVSDIVLQILSFVAETERQKIKERQAQGIKCAKERGVKFGRPPTALPDNMDECLERYRDGLSLRAAAKAAGISASSFFRAAKAAGIEKMEKGLRARPGRKPAATAAPCAQQTEDPAYEASVARVRAYLKLPARARWANRGMLTDTELRMAEQMWKNHHDGWEVRFNTSMH